ncbi:hypothetical protein ACFFNY_26295 [Paenibacillus hodogayensis]|uniref:Hydrolase n=1 Tax=Paenibacillus hodogayensis TaxID=279208 RepID=A0ABV5W3E3_9BACL
MTNKTIYDVSVSAGTITEQAARFEQPDRTYEFSVEATDDEIGELRRLLDSYADQDMHALRRAPVPYKSADHDEATESFNNRTYQLYAALYALGTTETRDYIEQSQMLAKLRNPDYEHPGYERR